MQAALDRLQDSAKAAAVVVAHQQLVEISQAHSTRRRQVAPVVLVQATQSQAHHWRIRAAAAVVLTITLALVAQALAVLERRLAAQHRQMARPIAAAAVVQDMRALEPMVDRAWW
jgi:hypothetical protein